jgi:RecA/RadA recombinase
MRNYLNTALEYHALGLRVLPVKADKTPYGPWKKYQDEQTEDDVRELFSRDSFGIAIITGVDGLEVIDIDSKYDHTGRLAARFILTAENFNDMKAPMAAMVMEETTSKGYHVFYRCPNPQGNTKLAARPPFENEDPNTNPVLLETRGIGGYCVVYPTPGYELIRNDFDRIPTITQAERDTILAAAKSFNEVIEVEPVIVPRSAVQQQPGEDVTPWDDFNDREDCIDLLQKYGWTVVYKQGEKVFLKRPGKSDAKTSGNYHEGKKLFVAHTTSTPLPAEKGLTAYSIYKYYEHGGDSSAAAKALYAAGYGKRPERITDIAATIAPKKTEEEAKAEIDEMMKEVWASRYTYGPIRHEDATFSHINPDSGKRYNIGGNGMLGVITGRKKSGKTFVMLHIVASAIAGKKAMGFNVALQPGQNILFVDTEQSRFFFEVTQHEVYDIAGVTAPANYYAFHLRKWSVAERIIALRKLIDQIPNLGLIVIDGAVDLCPDMMDYDKSTKTVQELMRICETTGAMVLTVLHLTKMSNEMRGHLGTELGNKCDFSIAVEKDNMDLKFTVKSMDSRFTPFPAFIFEREEATGKLVYFEREPTPQPASSQFPAMRPNSDLENVPF